MDLKIERNKNCFKKNNSKTAEVTSDIIGNKIVDKMTSVRKSLLKYYKMTKWKDRKKRNICKRNATN